VGIYVKFIDRKGFDCLAKNLPVLELKLHWLLCAKQTHRLAVTAAGGGELSIVYLINAFSAYTSQTMPSYQPLWLELSSRKAHLKGTSPRTFAM